MARWIDADAVFELLEPFTDAFDNFDVCSAYVQTLNAIANAPSIKTKQIKYYDEFENVWKTGEVIIDE